MSLNDKRGSLNINSENMFPIIRKWLYQDHDIFFRELISNGCDAITKLKKLSLIGEYTAPEGEKYRIDVVTDPENSTITFSDNGLGMTFDEVDSYINQVAFSGAADFLDKYKDKASEDQIIGHFGLGFYSAFMVADKVTIDTLSYKEGAEPVLWASEDGTEFEMTRGTRAGHGTDIVLTINNEELKFCNEYQARETIEKYCSFMPVEIYVADAAKERKKAEEEEKKAKEEAGKAAEEAKEAEGASDAGEGAGKEPAKEEPKPINDTNPLWNESPSSVTAEQYKEFYRKVFRDYREPLFWIHLNMDYPFNLKGILYFPKVNAAYENVEGVIKLYNNQVFIADNIKEVIPEYLFLLKGCIDCPDLPLNVSRSALQNDGFVKKISDYITKKVSDKLTGMFKTDRENYEKYWGDISPFIKYGCLKDDKFADKMKDAIIFKNLEGKFLTAGEYIKNAEGDLEAGDGTKAEGTIEIVEEGEAAGVKESAGTKEAAEDAAAGAGDDGSTQDAKAEEKEEKTDIFYVTDEKEQSQYIRMFREGGKDAVLLTDAIDTPFISFYEMKNEKVRFIRIDADLTEALKGDEEQGGEIEKIREKLVEFFRDALNDKELDVKVETLKDESIASIMTMSEEERRMQEMMKMYAAYGMDMPPEDESQTLVLNSANKLVKRLMDAADAGNATDTDKKIAEQLYDMALLSRGPIGEERMYNYLKRSQELMMELL